ncbi:phospholipase C/P1 nuclease [Pholiota conissans]|uniref:Phospholipase C/P1 nuclease n=1 Tax=Pholiota conissans TaxID=109636 RepID=A0A9P5Z7M4_9AGAR|nr:phospholipase C/P1 nuclease [Pholiota conissans]
MRIFSSYAAIGVALGSIPGSFAWGAAGHEIVATIAQMYLHPRVLPTLCGILELPNDRCHLASVATWADQHRYQMRWSAALHYVGALDDYPSETCAFPGPRGWAGHPGVNVLDGIQNTTRLLQDWVNEDASHDVANEALKFLIHFVGDMHQPLHLTGRDRGGNSVKVRFGQRTTNLHSLWDGYLIAQGVRTVSSNYSRPLPYPKIERALRGTIYDSYIRRIMWEGLLHPWAGNAAEWLSCAADAEPTEPSDLMNSGLLGAWQSAYRATQKMVATFMRDGVEIMPDGPVLCPHHWAKPLHQLNCEIVWPKALDDVRYSGRFDSRDNHDCADEALFGEEEEEEDDDDAFDGLLDLDTPEYAGVIAKRLLIEKLLAQGGIRLAGLLNYIFAREGPELGPFVVNM